MKQLAIIIVIGFMSACKLPAVNSGKSSYNLPGSFNGQSDTTNTTEVNRKLFFTSPYLNELIDSVLANNYDLLMATQRIQASQASVRQAKGPLLPQVNAVAMPSLRKFGLYTMDGAGNIVTEMEPGKLVPVDLPDYYLGLQASWEVDLWGKLKNRKKAAMARFLASTQGQRLIRTALVAETASAYYELLAADQEIKLLDQTILLQEQALEMARVQKDAAAINELAVLQFEAQLLGMKSLRYEVLQKIVDAETRINLLAARDPQTVKRDSSFFNSQSLPMVKAGVPAQLLRNRPDIMQAEWELEAAKADVLSARAMFLPALNITGQLGVQGYKPSLLFTWPESVAYALIGGLTAPVLNRNMIKGEFAKASAMQQEALLNYERTINRSFQEVNRELLNIRNLEKIYDLKSSESSVMVRSVQVSNDLFRTGRADYLEVLIARQQSLRSNIEMIIARRNQFLSSINLYRALGGGIN